MTLTTIKPPAQRLSRSLLHPQGRPSFVEYVAQWLTEQEARGHFPLIKDAGPLIRDGHWCGVRVYGIDGRTVYLVTRIALVSCLARYGLPCATMDEVRRALYELVELGFMSAEVSRYAMPSLKNRTSLYALDASIVHGGEASPPQLADTIELTAGARSKA